MTNKEQALTLQIGSLAVLWLSLFSISQAQTLVLVALPCLIVLQRWAPPVLRKRRRFFSHAVAMPLIGMALATTPLSDRNAWLAGFSNLLWLLCGLKLLELDAPGAIRRNGLLLLIAIGAAGTFAQDLGPSLLQGMAAILAIGSLLALELGSSQGTQLLRQALVLVAVSLPLMVALFLLVPRLGPLWLLQGGGSRTGLSDQLDPGSIASLARSDAAAMKLQFVGTKPPPPAERYWRVMTLQQFDGRRWSAEAVTPSLAAPTAAEVAARKPQLLVLLEPTNLRWLPWGGTGLPFPASIRRSSDGGLWQPEPVRGRTFYRLAGAGQSGPEPWRFVPPEGIDLAVPAQGNPQLKQLGAGWRQLPTPELKVQAARDWFIAHKFQYTLEPGLLPTIDGLDHFLFSQREGFCEHFAAAFTALMREANVPARVVVGYQGGEWVEPLGGGVGHLQVRQSDAHAWSEVWLPERGWARVDPTSWVVPSRLEQNLYDSLGEAGRSSDQQLLRRSPDWLHWLQGQWQTMDLNWSLWVMQFDQAKQEEVLRKLLGAHPERLQGAVLLGSISALLAAALMVMRWIQPTRRDHYRRQLETCLGRLGVDCKLGDSLEHCLQQAKELHPTLKVELDHLGRTYGELRFRPGVHADSKSDWKNCLQQLARKRKRWYHTPKKEA